MFPWSKQPVETTKAQRGALTWRCLNPSGANEVQNEHHQGNYDQDVNEAAGYVKRQAAEPEQ